MPLLTTKLYTPRPQPNRVARPSLIARLEQASDRPVTLVCAPAGFGKTTLLAEWLARGQRLAAWLSLDEGDNDPARFWTYVVAALQTLQAGVGESALVMLQSPQSPPIESVLTGLLNDLAAFSDETMLVLDDYHTITAPMIHTGLEFFVEHMPPPLRLIIASRSDPPLPLSRYRVRARMAELRADDLRFTVDEAAAFLRDVMGLSLSAQDVAALEARTEGWIAGLQLAALSMQGQSDVSGFIAAFTGSNRFVVDYLAREVLRQQPAEIVAFLLQTSILDRLNGLLCDAVLGRVPGPPDSQAMLERLERSNLFVIPLDDQRQWFRYHHLFREVLARQLRQTYPDQAPALHRRASRWFEQHGLPDDAVNHALAAADYEQAMQLIEDIFEASLRKGRILDLLRWISAIPDEQIRARPRLCLAYSWSLSAWTSAGDRSRSWETIEHWIQAALRAVSPEDPVAGAIQAEALVLRANKASVREDFASTLDLSQRALEHLPPDSPWRTLMMMFSGEAHLMVGDTRIAVEKLGEASAMSRRAGSNDFWMLSTTHLAEVKAARGALREAAALYQQVVEYAARSQQPVRRSAMAHSGLAAVLYERNRLEEAFGYVQKGQEIIERVGGSFRTMIVNAIPMARVQQAQGNGQAALETLTRLDRLAQQEQVHPFTQAFIAAWRARLQLAQGDLKSVARWAAESGLNVDDAGFDQFRSASRQVAYATLARWSIRSGEPEAALDLLQRLIDTATATGRTGYLVELWLLQALACSASGNADEAQASLQNALTLAKPEGYIRTVVDEGDPMRTLLADSRWQLERRAYGADDETIRQSLAYVDELLAAFHQPSAILQPSTIAHQPSASSYPVEPLTDRELEVLRFVAEGLTDRQIAERLTVVVGTVKRHLNNLYGKLGVHSRTQALARARELRLI